METRSGREICSVGICCCATAVVLQNLCVNVSIQINSNKCLSRTFIIYTFFQLRELFIGRVHDWNVQDWVAGPVSTEAEQKFQSSGDWVSSAEASLNFTDLEKIFSCYEVTGTGKGINLYHLYLKLGFLITLQVWEGQTTFPHWNFLHDLLPILFLQRLG